MFTKKSLISALIAAGALAAVAAPLPSAAANFDFSFNATPVHHEYDRRSYDRRDDFRGQRFQPSRFDRDGDGIPNWRDPTPDGFRGSRMHDRDRDGVPDRFDRYPNNPRWY